MDWLLPSQSRSGSPPPDLEAVAAPLRQEVAEWCDARPDASTLSIAAAYEELILLDKKEQSMLPPKLSYPRPPWVKPRKEEILQKARWNAIVQAFDPRRQLLRARALELSRDGLRPLRLTDLPLEILRIVFSDLEDDAIAGAGLLMRKVNWEKYRRWDWKRNQAVRLRLVCRLFHDLASPYMFRILRVELSQSSLDLVDKISRCPAIAAGVRAIQISLAYRPKEYADSIARYARVRLDDLRERKERCLGQYDFDEGKEEDDKQQRLRTAIKNYGLLKVRWRKHVRAVSRGEVSPDSPLSEEQQFLATGYAEFRRLSQEQHRLIEDGTFANALASAVARMPNACSFSLTDPWQEVFDYDDTDVLNEKESLSLLLVRPMRWQEIKTQNQRETHEAPARLGCAKLLWQLPIALHRAGVRMAELQVNNLPQYSDASVLCAQDENGAPLWAGLSAACEQLEVFDLSLRAERGLQTSYLPTTNTAHIDKFLGTVLSRCSPHLQVLELDFCGFFVFGDWRDGSYPVDNILAHLQDLPKIRRLALCNLDLTHKALDKICKNLGSAFESISLQDVRLHGGIWADAIDDLRAKLEPVLARQPRYTQMWFWRVMLMQLYGGEIPVITQHAPSQLDYIIDTLVSETRDYLVGELDHNPLRNRVTGWVTES